MATAVGNLFVNIRGRTAAFGADMKKAGGMVNGFRATVAAASKQMVVMFAPLAGIAGFVKLIKTSEDFNKAMNSSIAIMKDVSQVMRDDMTKAALAVSRETVFAANEAAGAFFFLASAGLDAEQSLAALPTVATFAQAGMFDLALATDLLTDAQSALGLASKDAQQNLLNMKRVGNVLVKANTLANASVQQFSEALTGKAGSSARALGKTVEETVAVLAVFADQGLKGADASTALSIVWRDLTTKAIKNEAAFRRAGIAVFDVGGEIRNTAAIVGDLTSALDGMSDKQKKATLLQLGFTDKSVVFVQKLLGMQDAIEQNENSLTAIGDVMGDVAGQQMTPLQKAWEQLKASFEEAAISLTPVIEQFASVVSLMSDIIDKAKKLGSAMTNLDLLGAAGDFFFKLPEARESVIGVDRPPPPPPPLTEAERAAFAGEASREDRLRQALAAEAVEKAEEEASKAAKELAKNVDAMAKSLRTPFEVARDELMSLRGMRRGLGEELFGRGLEQLRNQFLPEPTAATDGAFTAQALQAGSEGAVRAIIRAQFGGPRQRSVEDKQLRELEAIRKLLDPTRQPKQPQLVATIQP